MRLTRAGAELVPRAERIVAEWEAPSSALARASDCALVIGMHTSPGRGLLPEVRARLVGDCPEARARAAPGRLGRPHRRPRRSRTDAAFVWLPLPQPPYRWVTVAREPRLVAMAIDHRLAGRARSRWPTCSTSRSSPCPRAPARCATSGSRRDARDGRPARIAAEINDTEETYEAVATGIGVCLLAAGNAPIFARGDVTMLPVRDLRPSELVLAWNERHCPPLLESFAALCEEVVTGDYTSAPASDSVGSRRVNHSDRSAASASAPRGSRGASSRAAP